MEKNIFEDREQILQQTANQILKPSVDDLVSRIKDDVLGLIKDLPKKNFFYDEQTNVKSIVQTLDSDDPDSVIGKLNASIANLSDKTDVDSILQKIENAKTEVMEKSSALLNCSRFDKFSQELSKKMDSLSKVDEVNGLKEQVNALQIVGDSLTKKCDDQGKDINDLIEKMNGEFNELKRIVENNKKGGASPEGPGNSPSIDRDSAITKNDDFFKSLKESLGELLNRCDSLSTLKNVQDATRNLCTAENLQTATELIKNQLNSCFQRLNESHVTVPASQPSENIPQKRILMVPLAASVIVNVILSIVCAVLVYQLATSLH